MGACLEVSERLWTPLVCALERFPRAWDGKAAILDLRDADFNWRQMEWIGWYFELLCKQRLSPWMRIPGPRHKNVEFDAFLEVPWDFKAHVTRGPKGQAKHSVIINDKEAVDWAIDRYGRMGLIVASGLAAFNDEDRSFWMWHNELKGGLSAYEMERRRRKAPSRLRKMSLDVVDFRLYLLDSENKSLLRLHRQGRNADGSPRRPKYQIDLRRIEPVAVVGSETKSV